MWVLRTGWSSTATTRAKGAAKDLDFLQGCTRDEMGYFVVGFDEFNIHPEKESELKILDWERTHFPTKYYCLRLAHSFGQPARRRAATNFAHPGHPGERGTNENTNGLMREVFFKRYSLLHLV